MLELQRTRLQRDLESAEGEERLSTIDLREAILNQKVEGIQGGPLTGKKIAAQKRTVAARQATLDMIQKIKDICDQSVEHLTSIRDKEKQLLAETLAKAAAKEVDRKLLTAPPQVCYAQQFPCAQLSTSRGPQHQPFPKRSTLILFHSYPFSFLTVS